MSNKLIIIIILFITLNKNFAQPLISVTASRYHIQVINKADYHLSISLTYKGKIKQNAILSKNEDIFYSGYFSKRKLKKTIIKIEYNQYCYDYDLAELQDQYKTKLKSLNSYYNYYSESNMELLAVRILADYGSKSKYKIIKGIAFVFNFADDLFSTFSELAEVKTKSELIEFIANHAFNIPTSELDILYRLIDEKFPNGILSSRSARAIALYIQNAHDLNNEYDNTLKKLNNWKKEQTVFLKSLLSKKIHESFNVYDVATRPIILKTITPKYIINFSPGVYSSSLGEYWKPTADPLFNKDEEADLSFGIGWVDSQFKISTGVAISREYSFGRNSFLRIYLMGEYYTKTYNLRSDNFMLSRSYFSQIPAGKTEFILSNPISLDLKQYGGKILIRNFISKKTMIDLTAGVNRTTGTLNLANSDLSEGFVWVNNKINYIVPSIIPYLSTNIGYGVFKPMKTSYYFIFGITISQAKFKAIKGYKIQDIDTNTNIELNSTDFFFNSNVGFSITF